MENWEKQFEEWWLNDDSAEAEELWNGPANAKGWARLAWKAALESMGENNAKENR